MSLVFEQSFVCRLRVLELLLLPSLPSQARGTPGYFPHTSLALNAAFSVCTTPYRAPNADAADDHRSPSVPYPRVRPFRNGRRANSQWPVLGMRISDVVSELEAKMEEPQNKRDQRVEELWRKLDPAGQGELDLKGLQRGLRRIDHRKLLLACPSPCLRSAVLTHLCRSSEERRRDAQGHHQHG